MKFVEHKFSLKCKYRCSQCDYQFVRTLTDYWTESPFNKRFMEGKVQELNIETIAKLKRDSASRECPKCGAETERMEER